MAIPKKGLRKIHVDGIDYRWLIRRKTRYNQTDYGIGKIHVAIDHFDNPGSNIVIFTNIPHPKDCMNREETKAVPSDIKKWIREALELGWKPTEEDKQLRMKIKNGKLTSDNN